MNNDILISEVFKRKALWDTTLRDYRKRDVARSLWDEVAEILQSDREMVKRKWKHLRDNYRSELNKIRNTEKTGCGTVKKYKWAHFEAMNFLRDTLSTAPSEENCDTPDPNCYLENVFTLEEEPTSEPTEIDLSESSFTNDLNANSANSYFTYSKNTLKRKYSTTDDAFIQLEKEKLKLRKAENDMKNDSDYNFLISLLPHLKSLSEMNNLKFRLETTKILMQIKSEDSATNNFK